MDRSVQDYLVKAHNKVIAHYRQVLRANALTQPERAQIQKRLAEAEGELAGFSGSSLGPYSAEAT
jgi:hypothetical protein